MAYSPTDNLTNIKLISSPVLLRRLFEIHAPSLDLDWGKLNRMSMAQRAEKLHGEMLRLNDIALKEHDDLCKVLSTIAIISSDSDHTPLMKRLIDNIGLHDKFALFNFGLNKNAVTTANIAAWVNVHCHAVDIQKDKREDLKRIWQQLQVLADNITQEGAHYSFDISEPNWNPLEIDAGLRKFEANLRECNMKKTGLKSFPVTTSMCSRGNYIHFTVNMPKYPRDSLQSKDDLIFLDRDRNMTGLTIDYYPQQEYLWVSRFVDKPTTRDIAERFAKFVLKTSIPDARKNHYPLTLFRDRRYIKWLQLTSANPAPDDRVWVSAIDCAYYASDGTLLSICNEHECDDQDIHQRIEAHHPGSRYPYDKREILSVEVSFLLHEQADIGARRKAVSTATRKYRFTFKPVGIGPRAQLRKIQNSDHREIIKATLNNCGLLGMNIQQLAAFLAGK